MNAQQSVGEIPQLEKTGGKDWQHDLAAAMLVDAENQILIAEAREFIVNHFISGWITADHALTIMIENGLIEFSPELLAECEAA